MRKAARTVKKMEPIAGRRKRGIESRDEKGKHGGGEGLKIELMNAKELSGISHLIKKATRLVRSRNERS